MITIVVARLRRAKAGIGNSARATIRPGMPGPIEDKGKYMTVYVREKNGSLKIKAEIWNTDVNPMQMGGIGHAVRIDPAKIGFFEAGTLIKKGHINILRERYDNPVRIDGAHAGLQDQMAIFVNRHVDQFKIIGVKAADIGTVHGKSAAENIGPAVER